MDDYNLKACSPVLKEWLPVTCCHCCCVCIRLGFVGVLEWAGPVGNGVVEVRVGLLTLIRAVGKI